MAQCAISIDVNKAFLQGLTYDELAKLTGEPRRQVAFTLPKGAAAQLRKIPGYESFDPSCEALHCESLGQDAMTHRGVSALSSLRLPAKHVAYNQVALTTYCV